MTDEDDYPTEQELTRIREWPSDWEALMAYIKELWHWPDWGWRKKETKYEDFAGRVILATGYTLCTGGWSGNEDIIQAMQENILFWGFCWNSSTRGGRHEFEVKHDRVQNLRG